MITSSIGPPAINRLLPTPSQRRNASLLLIPHLSFSRSSAYSDNFRCFSPKLPLSGVIILAPLTCQPSRCIILTPSMLRLTSTSFVIGLLPKCFMLPSFPARTNSLMCLPNQLSLHDFTSCVRVSLSFLCRWTRGGLLMQQILIAQHKLQQTSIFTLCLQCCSRFHYPYSTYLSAPDCNFY